MFIETIEQALEEQLDQAKNKNWLRNISMEALALIIIADSLRRIAKNGSCWQGIFKETT